MSPPWTLKPVAVATLPVSGWECLMGRNDCGMRDLTFWVWILRKGDQIGLIDAGCPSGPDLESLNAANATLDARSVFHVHCTLEELLAAERIDPASIQFVLISQLITYCTGGLNDRNFPRATVWCAWDGMEEFLTRTPGHPPRDFYLTAESWSFFRRLLVENHLSFAKGPIEVDEGILYEPTGGHHPGSAGIRVQTARGIVGILETAFIQENIEREIPIGIAENAARCRDIIRSYKKQCDLVLAGHEPSIPDRLNDFLSGAFSGDAKNSNRGNSKNSQNLSH